MYSNRDKKLSPKLGKAWCFACDRALVAPGAKCPVCGTRMLPKKFKKIQMRQKSNLLLEEDTL